MTEARDLVAVLDVGHIRPILADVGSGGYRHSIWDPIADRSTIIGFDPNPDNRDNSFSTVFADGIFIDKVVCPDDALDSVAFNFTRRPSCSSMLQPDMGMVGTYSFRDFFRVERTVTVPATSLNRVLRSYKVRGFDWIKLDAQGADLSLLKSLEPKRFDKLLAVDVEPGIMAFYHGEDTFSVTHDYLLARGFWLSDMNVQRYEKVHPETLDRMLEEVGESDPEGLRKRLRKAPTAVEALYLRELNWMIANASDPRSLALLFVFAVLTGQLPFAFDVLYAYEKLHGRDGLFGIMAETGRARLVMVESPGAPRRGQRVLPEMKERVNNRFVVLFVLKKLVTDPRWVWRKIEQRVINRFAVLFVLKKLVTDPWWVWRKTLVRLGVRSRDAD